MPNRRMTKTAIEIPEGLSYNGVPSGPKWWHVDGGRALLAIGIGSAVAMALLLALGIGEVANTYKENGIATGSLREAKQHERMEAEWQDRFIGVTGAVNEALNSFDEVEDQLTKIRLHDDRQDDLIAKHDVAIDLLIRDNAKAQDWLKELKEHAAAIDPLSRFDKIVAGLRRRESQNQEPVTDLHGVKK